LFTCYGRGCGWNKMLLLDKLSLFPKVSDHKIEFLGGINMF